MLVQDIMTSNVITISPDMPIEEVHALMEARNVRHFPILEANTLLGIVSDRDVRSVGSHLPNMRQGIGLQDPVRSIMQSPVITAHPLDPVEESAHTLRDHKIGAMPVLDDDKLVGIVTGIDFLEALVKMTGVQQAASRLEVEVSNQPSGLATLVQAISEQGFAVSSVLSSAYQGDSVRLVLRVNTINVHELAQALRAEGFAVSWPPALS